MTGANWMRFDKVNCFSLREPNNSQNTEKYLPGQWWTPEACRNECIQETESPLPNTIECVSAVVANGCYLKGVVKGSGLQKIQMKCVEAPQTTYLNLTRIQFPNWNWK
jgi:hypothetical protein